jgi:hypothetical protein
MDDSRIAKIFAPFFIAKPSGHWLGLAAVQSVIRRHPRDTRIIAFVAKASYLLYIKRLLSDSPLSTRRQHAELPLVLLATQRRRCRVPGQYAENAADMGITRVDLKRIVMRPPQTLQAYSKFVTVKPAFDDPELLPLLERHNRAGGRAGGIWYGHDRRLACLSRLVWTLRSYPYLSRDRTRRNAEN